MVDDDVDDVLAIESQNNPHPWSQQIFFDCLRVKYPSYVMLDIDDNIIGFAIISMMVDETHLLNIAIDQHHRRKGLGGQLMTYVLEVSQQLSAKQMLLEVRRSNKAAISLYLKEGFRQIGLRKDYYRTDDGREDALVLRLLL